MQKRIGRSGRVRFEGHAVGAEETQQRLVAPHTQRVAAKIRRATHVISVDIVGGFADRIAQHVVERFIGIEHQRPRRPYRSQCEAARIDEIGPFTLHDDGAGSTRELHGMISRVRVEHKHVDRARQASEGTWQIALFVAGENDGSD